MAVHGYAKFNPKPEALYWIGKTDEVLREFRDYWPLSVRQIFYRLVAAYDYEKTERAYGRLTNIISRARRAGMLPWAAIRDGGQGRASDPFYYDGEQGFYKTVRQLAREFRIDRQKGQDAVVELWCEAGGMFPILEGIGEPYSCRINTGSGYDSVTGKHQLACRIKARALDEKRRTIVLHVGDFDGSGEDMAKSLYDDVRLMAGQQLYNSDARPSEERDAVRWAMSWFEVERVALTAEQVLERNVETAPPKPTDSRTAAFVERNRWLVDELGTTQITAQLEALTPPELEAVLTEAIEARIDVGVYEDVVEEERDLRTSVVRWADR